jgi:drug/metabolite transporter (DMT)-like permease
MALVGSSVVVGKLALARFPVFLVAGLRFALAAVVLVPIALAVTRGRFALTRRDVAVLVLQAFTGIFAFNTLLLHGLALTSAAEAGIVTSTTPALAAGLASLALGERWTWRRGAAVTLAVLGILAINALAPGATSARGANPWLGNLLVLGAVAGEAVFLVCSRVLAQRLPAVVVATGITVVGLAMFAPFALREARAFDFARVDAGGWLAVVYYAIAVTVVAFLLWARGVADVPAGTAAVFTGVLPVSAVVLSYVVLGEPFRWSHLVGGACVLGAIALTARGD